MENENSVEIYCALFEEGSNLPAESEIQNLSMISVVKYVDWLGSYPLFLWCPTTPCQAVM